MPEERFDSMAKSRRFPLRAGILGGGQLARMLALKGHEMGLEIHVLSPDSGDPAAQVVRHHHPGSPTDEKALRTFFKHVDLVTFESEFMDASALERLSDETRVPVRPRPSLMAMLQDRLTQKKWLQSQGLPTAAFRSITDAKQAESAFAAFKGRVVFKKRRFGYDGYGTYIARDETSLRVAIDAIESDRHGFIAEAFIPFRREVALMVARRPSGETVALPFVETFQENSRCLWVKGPIAGLRGGSRLTTRLKKGLESTDYEGILGVELFETPRGLLVNELAPRVHNSAHYSLEGLTEDQFTVHWKAVLDLPFSPVRPRAGGFAMYNLLGHHSRPPSWEFTADIHLHWYGKLENRPGRKMGHITATASSSGLALKRLVAARTRFDV